MNTKQQGFTLIELVVVIVILGILAAVAVPKFVGIQSDARAAVARGVEASIHSAADLVHAKALAQNVAGATGTLPTGNIEGVGAINLVFGYPVTGAMASLVNITGTTVTATAASGLFQINGVATPASCRVTYTQPASATSGYTVTATVTNCN